MVEPGGQNQLTTGQFTRCLAFIEIASNKTTTSYMKYHIFELQRRHSDKIDHSTHVQLNQLWN